MEKIDIAQQRGKKVVIVEHHGNGRHSEAAWKKVVIAHQRGKSGHSGASWKRKSQRSSVDKGDIVEQHRKIDTAAFKK